MQNSLNAIRNQSSTSSRCLLKYTNSNFHAQICSVLIDQYLIFEEALLAAPISSSQTNDCKDFGGQCIPNSLIVSSSMSFTDSDLTCPIGFICWLQ
ncbi:unnamed protein product, partial [Rotaria magnacalcarata]